MTRFRARWPSPALVVACLALFAALGGTTYAATSSGTSRIRFTSAKLMNGWIRYGAGNAAPGYAKDSLGVVHLRGAIKSGSDGSVAFVLPKALRTRHYLHFPIFAAGGEATVEIAPNGDVVPFGTGVTAQTALDSISFVASE